MRYWRDRDISDRLTSDRANRKEAREPKQLSPAVGFQFDTPDTQHTDDDEASN